MKFLNPEIRSRIDQQTPLLLPRAKEFFLNQGVLEGETS